MAFLKLLLSSSIIYITIITIASPMHDEESEIKEIEIHEEPKIANRKSNNKYPIPYNVFTTHYNINFTLLNNYLVSECMMTIHISLLSKYIKYYVPDSTNITAWRLIQDDGTIYETISIYRSETNLVLFDFGDFLLTGMYNLYIQFKIPINIVRESFGIPYINKNKEIEWLIATGIQRRNRYQAKKQHIFPYWDNKKANVCISIMHHSKYKALSNMQMRRTSSSVYDNMTWTHFHKANKPCDKSNRIYTDSVVFLVSDFHKTTIKVDAEAISHDLWCRPQSKSHLEFAKNVIIYISRYMRNFSWTILKKGNFSYERKVDHVVIPDLQDEYQLTFGFIFYREADITYNKKLDPVAYKTIIARLIARGMIQKYITNLYKLMPVYGQNTMTNEGFIVFLHSYIIDKALPNSRMMDLFVVQLQHELLYLNTYVVINYLEYNSYPENHFYSAVFHIKESIICRMLERTMPPDVFIMGVKRFVYNQLDGITYSRAISGAMKSAMTELNSTYEFNRIYNNTENIIDSWIMQRYPPVLMMTRNYFTNVVNVWVQFYHNLDEIEYYIPVTYTTESNPYFTITTNIWLTQDSKIELFLDKNQWIIFNLQQAGYYRVNYDFENWLKIAQYLNSEEYSNIHILNRAQIINDAFHFAIDKKLEFSVFWKLASYLAKEQDYIAWYPMFKAFEVLSNIFPFLEHYPELQNFRFSSWNLYDESDIDDHTECLKQELAKWECILNDHACEEKSRDHLKWHLANPKENKLLPGWKRWTYCNGLKTADSDTWNKVFNDYMKGNDIILECLAYSKNSDIIINYLEIKLPQVLLKPRYNLSNAQLEPTERNDAFNANIFLSTIERNTKYMLTSLLNNYEKIRHRRVNEIATLIVIINNAYSKKQLDEIKKFVKKELKNSIISITDVEDKMETRWSEIQRQIKYFRFLFNN